MSSCAIRFPLVRRWNRFGTQPWKLPCLAMRKLRRRSPRPLIVTDVYGLGSDPQSVGCFEIRGKRLRILSIAPITSAKTETGSEKSRTVPLSRSRSFLRGRFAIQSESVEVWAIPYRIGMNFRRNSSVSVVIVQTHQSILASHRTVRAHPSNDGLVRSAPRSVPVQIRQRGHQSRDDPNVPRVCQLPSSSGKKSVAVVRETQVIPRSRVRAGSGIQRVPSFPFCTHVDCDDFVGHRCGFPDSTWTLAQSR